MNKIHRTLSLIILSSTLILSATEDLQQNTPQTVSFYAQATTNLHHAWHNKWVKAGTFSTVCAIAYAIGVRYNVVPAPSLPALSLLALPVIAKKTIDTQDLSQNPKNDAIIVDSTDNSQEPALSDNIIPANDERLIKNDQNEGQKTISFPSKKDLQNITDDLRKATQNIRKWLLDGVRTYTTERENYQ